MYRSNTLLNWGGYEYLQKTYMLDFLSHRQQLLDLVVSQDTLLSHSIPYGSLPGIINLGMD